MKANRISKIALTNRPSETEKFFGSGLVTMRMSRGPPQSKAVWKLGRNFFKSKHINVQ